MPILLALCEYGLILNWKKLGKKSNHYSQLISSDFDSEHSDPVIDLDERMKKLDYATMIFSFLSFSTFVSIYWIFLPDWN